MGGNRREEVHFFPVFIEHLFPNFSRFDPDRNSITKNYCRSFYWISLNHFCFFCISICLASDLIFSKQMFNFHIVSCGFGHIYWILNRKRHYFLCSVTCMFESWLSSSHAQFPLIHSEDTLQKFAMWVLCFWMRCQKETTNIAFSNKVFHEIFLSLQ